ncbi:MAG TPA: molybdopterin-binding protein [Caulobacteraceae bacterium]|jgi:DMSO/TMAO reductase YedYZ molybdopterin-dependent catalytic subunit|nr:molybdopterin-binding protein [Caulobacteraceae bacterium]
MALMSRRALITTAGAGGLLLSGCDRLTSAPAVNRFIGHGEALSFHAQRLLLAGQPLAREFTTADISPVFKANGTMAPQTADYLALQADNFASWRLAVDGVVHRPMSFSLADLRALPSRTQITRHDCVEGWSAIGGWTGVQLSRVLALVGLMPNARFVVFHCADDLAGSGNAAGLYYESLDLFDAFHPQTILAYAMNGAPLAVAHGAPLRLRVERQLGYKQAKYVMRLEITDRLDRIAGGKGGFWEDRGYEWYAGI